MGESLKSPRNDRYQWEGCIPINPLSSKKYAIATSEKANSVKKSRSSTHEKAKNDKDKKILFLFHFFASVEVKYNIDCIIALISSKNKKHKFPMVLK